MHTLRLFLNFLKLFFAKLLSFVFESWNSPALPFLLRTCATLLMFCLPIKRVSRCFFSLTTYTHTHTHTIASSLTRSNTRTLTRSHTRSFTQSLTVPYSPAVRSNTQVSADVSWHPSAAARNWTARVTLLVSSAHYQLTLLIINILRPENPDP
jgi:hypothetical protein